MNPRQPMNVEQSPIWKILIVSSFIMLSMLTWMASPLQKLVEKVQHKETVKAQLKVCQQVRAMFPVYTEWVQRLWVSGCIWENVQIHGMLFPDTFEEVLKQVKANEGIEFEKMLNRCSPPAAAALKDNEIADRIVTPIYFEQMKCPELYEEAKKLGIEDEDVQ